MEYVNYSAQLKKNSLRSVARHLVLDGLAAFWRFTGRIDRGLSRPRVHFLYLHHVFPDEIKGFRRLIEMLIENGQTIISYSEAVGRVHRGAIDRSYICFSFDDGIANNLAAAEVLAEYNISACFFLNSGIVGEMSADKVLEHCRVRFFGSPLLRFLDWDDVSRMQSLGHEIGGHTSTHVNMRDTPEPELRREIEQDREVLIRRCGEIHHFSWPYGRFIHFSLQAKRMVFAIGYKSVASAVRGCHVAENRQPCLRRENIVATWPLAHAKFFMARSSLASSSSDNGWGGLERRPV
ncbi:polysaccharide deacetylase family protein [Desulfovibrio ferrophilus]|uniref:polysaccharide deacetylase family protein n=1 Tax=Desulfovibrio ferrophilus TaxID=241368 RepID=UPI000F81EE27|nr:polysaccharide deacetylase family protein [Desulfovibrio ferrophilus]